MTCSLATMVTSGFCVSTDLSTRLIRSQTCAPRRLRRASVVRCMEQKPIVTEKEREKLEHLHLLQLKFVNLMDKQRETKPGPAFAVGGRYFKRELNGLIDQVKSLFRKRQHDQLPDVLGLTLDDGKVREREKERFAKGDLYERSPVLSRFVYNTICLLLDLFYRGRPIPRFWILETVARMPYFAILSVLHLYETFGWWHASELRKVHFAEDWNELHHLLIMESLGGDMLWSDRFLSSHSALVYYWVLVVTFILNPAMSYNFSELLENHAVDTYRQFYEENEEKLKKLPPPPIAKRYYEEGDLYLFDEFQTARPLSSRRPKCENLYDVFVNIHDDEIEHVKTMEACSDYTRLGKFVQSPHERHITERNDQFDAVVLTDDDNNVVEIEEQIKTPAFGKVTGGEKYSPPQWIRDEKNVYEEGMGL